VFPAAIPSAAGAPTPVRRFTPKAPSAAPGQSRRPYRASAASAMPAGAQTSVTLSAYPAICRPSRPVTK